MWNNHCHRVTAQLQFIIIIIIIIIIIFVPYIVGYGSGEDSVLRRSFGLRRREVSYVDIDVLGEHHGRVDKCSVFTWSVDAHIPVYWESKNRINYYLIWATGLRVLDLGWHFGILFCYCKNVDVTFYKQ